jgi:hypothetical protein
MSCSCCYCTFVAIGKKAKKEGYEIVAYSTGGGITVYKYPKGMDFQSCQDKSKYFCVGFGGMKYCEENIGE